MIGYLSGQVLRVFPGGVIIVTAGGIGYTVYITEKNLANFRENQQTAFYIETSVGEDFIKLYGFVTPYEQNLFNDLRSVQGLGPKGALAILSLDSYDKIVTMILREDENFFVQASGVGAKIAKRLVTELKDKMKKKHLDQVNLSASSEMIPDNDFDDITSILINLGYDKMKIKAALSQLKGHSFSNADEMIRKALTIIN